MSRTILHCDLNNFFASVEILHHSELEHVPIAVCGSVEERHGIVLAKNYPAKHAGVKTGEAIWQAKRKMPRAAHRSAEIRRIRLPLAKSPRDL